jgi:hypothetical protein
VCQSSARRQDAIHAAGMSAGRKGEHVIRHTRSHAQRCSASARLVTSRINAGAATHSGALTGWLRSRHGIAGPFVSIGWLPMMPAAPSHYNARCKGCRAAA